MFKILASRSREDFIVEHEGKLKFVTLSSRHHGGRGVLYEIKKNELRKNLRFNFQQHVPPTEIDNIRELEDVLLLFPEANTPEEYLKAITLFKDGKNKVELSEWDQLWNERKLFQRKKD